MISTGMGALRAMMEALPAAEFPLVTSMAAVMTAGDGDDRFEFGIDVLVAGLRAASERYR